MGTVQMKAGRLNLVALTFVPRALWILATAASSILPLVIVNDQINSD